MQNHRTKPAQAGQQLDLISNESMYYGTTWIIWLCRAAHVKCLYALLDGAEAAAF